MDFEIREDRRGSGRRLVREREKYFQLMQQGYGSREACRIVGINLRIGKKRRNGHRSPGGQRTPVPPINVEVPASAWVRSGFSSAVWSMLSGGETMSGRAVWAARASEPGLQASSGTRCWLLFPDTRCRPTGCGLGAITVAAAMRGCRRPVEAAASGSLRGRGGVTRALPRAFARTARSRTWSGLEVVVSVAEANGWPSLWSTINPLSPPPPVRRRQ